jgi:hypothetical protein
LSTLVNEIPTSFCIERTFASSTNLSQSPSYLDKEDRSLEFPFGIINLIPEWGVTFGIGSTTSNSIPIWPLLLLACRFHYFCSLNQNSSYHHSSLQLITYHLLSIVFI